MNEYPRVLVVNGQPFWQGCPTGLTLMSLFRGWPADRLACLYDFSRLPPEATFCKWQQALSRADLKFFRYISSRRPRKMRPAPEAKKETNVGEKSKWRYDSFVAYHLRRIKSFVPSQKLRELDTYRMPPAVLQRLDEFKPDVIFTTLASNPLMQVCLDVSRRLSVPIVPHFMDDWVTTSYTTSLFRTPLRKIMQRRLAEILERSPRRLVIGNAMAEEYARRYGGEFEPFMNCVEPELLERPTAAPARRDKVRLTYIGALHLNRWQSLRDIGIALGRLHEEGLEAEALIYAPAQFTEEAKRLNMPPVMRFAGTLPASEVLSAMRDAQIVIHVESFTRSTRTYTKYSVSTKIPQCMASARAILAYGPEELASIRYVRESGSGLALGSRDPDELKTALRQLIASEVLREQLGKQGYRTATLRHNAATERERFRAVLEDAARAKCA